MGSAAVTITPDQAPVTITPDAPPRTWTDSAKDFATEFWNQVNPVSAVKGLAQATSHPIDTLKSDSDARQKVYDQAEDAFKKGNYTEGAAHLLYSFIPFAGPQLNDAANNFLQGNFAKGAGASTGLGVNLAAPEVMKNLPIKVPTGDWAEGLYSSALKPSTAMGVDAAQQVVKTGIENKIPVSEEGLTRLNTLVKNWHDTVQSEIQHAAQNGATINKFDVTSRLADTAKKFSNQVNPEADIQAIGETGNEFLRNQPGQIPVDQAQALKQGTYQQLKNRSFGELKSATVEAQKALARGIKEELETQFPEIKSLNAEQAKLLNLDDVLDRAVGRIKNHQLLGIGTPMAAAAGAAITGSSIGALGMGIMKAVIDDPVLKSKLAITLNSASKGGIRMPAAAARIAAYSNALGNATPNDNQD